MAHPGSFLPVILCRQNCNPLDLQWIEYSPCQSTQWKQRLKTTELWTLRIWRTWADLESGLAWGSPFLPCTPVIGAVAGGILQCFESSRERVLLWPAVCSLVAKACGRTLMLVCPQSQGGWCVFSLVLNAFLGLCLNNSFIYILKLNYTLSILLHVMQPSSTQIKHRYSETTFAFLTPLRILYHFSARGQNFMSLQSYIVTLTKDHYGVLKWMETCFLVHYVV